MKKMILVFVALAFIMAFRPVFGTLVGDVNGDGKVDLRDIAIVARAFDTHPGDARWNPAADLNGDGVVNMMDIAIVAAHFGS